MKLLIVIPAANRDAANAVAAANFQDASNTFATEASATGNYPVTHYACGIECGGHETQIRGLVAAVGAACFELQDDPALAWQEAELRPVSIDRTNLQILQN